MIGFFLLSVVSACILRRQTPLFTFKEQIFSDKQSQRLTPEQIGEFMGRGFPAIYYLVEPTYSCDSDIRIGKFPGDGGKYICNLHDIIQKESCLYYGFGVDSEITFDEALMHYVPICEAHTFDPTPSVVSGPVPDSLSKIGVEFHAWGVSGANGQITLENELVPVFTFRTIQEKLGHTHRVIDILKVDVEGAELFAFNTLLENCEERRPFAYQIQVELHSTPPQILLEFDRNMELCGYRLFHKDLNLFWTEGIELAYVHQNFIKCH